MAARLEPSDRSLEASRGSAEVALWQYSNAQSMAYAGLQRMVRSQPATLENPVLFTPSMVWISKVRAVKLSGRLAGTASVTRTLIWETCLRGLLMRAEVIGSGVIVCPP